MPNSNNTLVTTPHTVVCQFPSNARQYHFICDLIVQAGATVVVNTQNDTHLELAKVAKVLPNVTQQSKRWVVDVVDTSRHEKRIQEEQRRKKLQAELDRRVAAASKLSQYQAMVQLDPSLAPLVEEYLLLEANKQRVESQQALVWDTPK